MNWKDFVQATDATAIYPEAGTGSVTELCYVALGLAGEMGEALEVADNTDLIKAELLDALWYVARGQMALKAHGYPVADVGASVVTTDNMLMSAPLLVANTTKKLLRDGIDKTKLDLLHLLYRDSLDGIFQMLSEHEQRQHKRHETYQQELKRFGLQLGSLIVKLNSRKDRGVLHGSGDSR